MRRNLRGCEVRRIQERAWKRRIARFRRDLPRLAKGASGTAGTFALLSKRYPLLMNVMEGVAKRIAVGFAAAMQDSAKMAASLSTQLSTLPKQWAEQVDPTRIDRT